MFLDATAILATLSADGNYLVASYILFIVVLEINDIVHYWYYYKVLFEYWILSIYEDTNV